MSKEPVVVIGAVMSLLALLVGFGVHINDNQMSLINKFLESAAPIAPIMIAAFVARAKVVPVEKANSQIQTAIDAQPGTVTVDQVIKKEAKEAKIDAQISK